MTCSFSPDSRRGISSVVGALIFTVLMIASFSAMSLALDSQTDIVNTQRVVAAVELQAQQEKFNIQVSTNVNNILNVTIDNIGQNPVQISHLFITNKTMASQPVHDFFITSDDAYISPGHQSNVVSTQTLYITPDIYDIKVISSLGTVKIAELNMISGSSDGLRAELITDPPDVIIGQNVTIAMIVTNTGSSTIENVIPGSLTVSPSSVIVASSSPIPASVNLTPGESVLFSWDYIISGNSGSTITFSSYASGTDIETLSTVTSNVVSDASRIRPNIPEGTLPDIINDELFARPQLYLTIPSSNGNSGEKSLWGITIANPINVPMKVSKLSIVAFAPGSNNNDKVFASPCGSAENISSGVSNNWSCPTQNVVMWKNTANPLVIPPNSTQSFLVKVPLGAIAGTTNLESVSVQANVFTTSGSFGKAGYQTTMVNTDAVIGSVYLSNVVDSRSNTDIASTRTQIIPGSTQTFNVVFADLDSKGSTFIAAGSKLIINVPKGWTDVQILSNPGFTDPVSKTTFGDGSTQIIGTTTSNLGVSANQADTIKFSAVAPIVSADRMYLMYILGEGQTETGFAIGPLSETVLQVNGS
ncbi:MAG: hypothetical protein WD717_09640 [Nitrosarchaeum sp.]